MRSNCASRTVVCAGIIALDQVFRVERLPNIGEKITATAAFIVNGGCAANAAVAIARLGGRAALAGPLGGPAGADTYGDQVLAALGPEGVDCTACVRIAGVSTPLSAIFLDRTGERTIVTQRDEALDPARPADAQALVTDADAVLVDNHFPEFVLPICKAARARDIPLVLDADRAAHLSDVLFLPRTWYFRANASVRRVALGISLRHSSAPPARRELSWRSRVDRATCSGARTDSYAEPLP
jgi:sulfofructose kinase